MVKQYIFWLGNTPALSAVEILTTFKRRRMKFEGLAVTDKYLLVGMSDELPGDFLRNLGGTDRIGEVIWEGNELKLENLKVLLANSQRKINLGLSGENVDRSELIRWGNDLKQALQKEGRKVRFILPTGKSGRLNAAQVIFNQLLKPPHQEWTLIRERDRWLAARTRQVQDIQAYERRDTARPARDLKVGMLPPKLAQMMLNLRPDSPAQTPVIYDPFCGMGTILQEGWLMGYQMVGSDNKAGMIEASRQNLAALARKFPVEVKLQPQLFRRDARQPAKKMTVQYDAIVTEPFLGPSRSTPLPIDQLTSYFKRLKNNYLDFFMASRELVRAGGYLIVALPAVRTRGQSGSAWHLYPEELVDEIKRTGYSLDQLVPPELTYLTGSTNRQTAFYARPDSMIGREITRWQRI